MSLASLLQFYALDLHCVCKHCPIVESPFKEMCLFFRHYVVVWIVKWWVLQTKGIHISFRKKPAGTGVCKLCNKAMSLLNCGDFIDLHGLNVRK